ncbi:hypothetical protein niasHS_002808 [Heterodera schachtii]|uniref:Chondroitin proteoglycan 4 domain-containing protein n=1 Tax=Heterodera schachtii TaxID=97005 RepID=A0ABD2K2J8_HETSC
MLLTHFLFLQLLLFAFASCEGNKTSTNDGGNVQHKNGKDKMAIGQTKSKVKGGEAAKEETAQSEGKRAESGTNKSDKSWDSSEEVDINAIWGTVGMPKCIDRCIKSLSSAMGRLLQFNETLDKFDDICIKYDEAVNCIHEKVLCLSSNVFEVITSGVEHLCKGPKKQFVKKHKTCLEKNLDKVAQGCDQKCHLARSLAQFSRRSDLRGVGLVHLLAVVNADSGPVCSAADCFLHCFREGMNQKCARSGGVITDGLLRPFYYLANLIQKSGRAIRKFLDDKLPNECKYLMKKETLDEVVKAVKETS